MLMKLILLLCIFLCGKATFSQTKQTVDSIENRYQECLDSGEFMTSCAVTFYYHMDSLLNRVYTKLQKGMDSLQKTALKKEETKWLAKRDMYFDKLELTLAKKTKEHGPAYDDQMQLFNDKALFVQNRVLELLKKFSKFKKQ